MMAPRVRPLATAVVMNSSCATSMMALRVMRAMMPIMLKASVSAGSAM